MSPSPTTPPIDFELLLDRLIEIQGFDDIPRLGYSQRGVKDCESVCEHSWHVAFLVSRLGRFVTGLDRLVAIEIALEHDLAELRTGDLPRPVAPLLPPGAKTGLERAVLDDLLEPLGVSNSTKGSDHQRETRFVKACDRLQLMIKAAAYAENGWRRCRQLALRGVEDAARDDEEFEVLTRLREALAVRLTH